MDDKILVIIAVTIIASLSIFAPTGTDTSILTQIITGLFGIAVGRTSLNLIQKKKNNEENKK